MTARPLIVLPQQINEFYAVDLAPGRSFAEYAVEHAIQRFRMSWRNPTAAKRDWNLETYLTAAQQALAQPTGTPTTRDCTRNSTPTCCRCAWRIR